MLASDPMGGQVHHVGICPADVEQSIRFYRDGLGLDLLFDVRLEVDVEPLLGVPTESVRTVFLGSRAQPEIGAVELMELPGHPLGDAPVGLPRRGACLLSFQLPVDATLGRLAELGLGGTPRRMTSAAGALAATVVDPDGTVVELLDQPLSLG